MRAMENAGGDKLRDLGVVGFTERVPQRRKERSTSTVTWCYVSNLNVANSKELFYSLSDFQTFRLISRIIMHVKDPRMIAINLFLFQIIRHFNSIEITQRSHGALSFASSSAPSSAPSSALLP